MPLSKLAHKVFTETLLRTESYALATAAEIAFRKMYRRKIQGAAKGCDAMKRRVPGSAYSVQ